MGLRSDICDGLVTSAPAEMRNSMSAGRGRVVMHSAISAVTPPTYSSTSAPAARRSPTTPKCWFDSAALSGDARPMGLGATPLRSSSRTRAWSPAAAASTRSQSASNARASIALSRSPRQVAKSLESRAVFLTRGSHMARAGAMLRALVH
eukprot:Amastigsp_a183431_23.p2 type:complete len:150 gc:universal Amastigsp_a183431_23:767-1216(+)